MSPPASQSLASGRDRREIRPTARAQQLIDQQQERAEREEQAKEQAKEKVISTRRTKLINQKGDELMYAPAALVAAPTLTDDGELDQEALEEFEKLEATYLLRLLGHRGDGDWTLYYESGYVDLPLLRKARDHPGAKVIEHAMEELGLTSAKGKGKAKGVDSNGSIAVPTGITIGKSTPELPAEKGNAPAVPRLTYPSSSPPAGKKRHRSLDPDPRPVKVSRIDVPSLDKLNGQNGRAAPVSLPVKPNALPPKSSATSLQTVKFGSRGREAVISDIQPNQESIRLEPRKPAVPHQNHDRDPPRPSKPTPSRNNADHTPSLKTPPARPTQKPVARNNPYDNWGNFGNVPQPRPLERPSATTARPDNNSARSPASRLKILRENLDASRDARLAAGRKASDMGQPPAVNQATAGHLRVDRPRGNKPSLNKTRADKSQRIPPQDAAQAKTTARQRLSNIPAAPLVQNRRPLAQQKQNSARNRQDNRLDRHNQEISEEEGEVGEDDEDDERNINAHFNNRGGPITRLNPKPSLGSFELYEQGVVKLMGRKAKPEIIAVGTYSGYADDPGDAGVDVDTIVAHWFAEACRRRRQRFPLLTEHIVWVKGLVTTYRHDVKELVTPLVQSLLGFVNGDRQFNREMVAWLLPDAFHEANPEAERDDRLPFESDFIFKAVARALFGPSKLGLKHQDLFCPVPVRFLAFVCSVCNHVIYCYRSGSFNEDEHLNSSIQEQAFQGYLEDMRDMHRERPAALRSICALMYDNGREAVGHQLAPQVDRPRRHWAPDIAEEYVSRFAVPAVVSEGDSENDDNYNRGARLPNHNKGKQVGSRDNHGSHRQSEPRYVNESDEDNHGEGPSKPYGVVINDEGDAQGWEDGPEPEEPSDEEMEE